MVLLHVRFLQTLCRSCAKIEASCNNSAVSEKKIKFKVPTWKWKETSFKNSVREKSITWYRVGCKFTFIRFLLDVGAFHKQCHWQTLLNKHKGLPKPWKHCAPGHTRGFHNNLVILKNIESQCQMQRKSREWWHCRRYYRCEEKGTSNTNLGVHGIHCYCCH